MLGHHMQKEPAAAEAGPSEASMVNAEIDVRYQNQKSPAIE